jgi:hypothetical protein
MPNLASFSVLDKRVKKYISDYNLDKLGTAFQWVLLELILSLNSSEIEEVIVDEGMDGGIDAVYISDTDVHIFTCTYAETFENASKNFPQNKLDSLIITVQKIFSRELTESDVNPLLWEKVKDIWSLISTGTPNLIFYIASNKEKPTGAAVHRFEDSLKPFHFVKFNYFDLEDIVSAILREKHHPVNGECTFIGRNHFQKSDGPLKAIVATISATDLVKLIADPTNESEINEEIFNDNVRIDLGLKNAINKGIYESAIADSNYEFWYLNNGIMLVCDNCDYIPNSVSPKATLTNVQIVNGGQTSRTLFHAYRKNPTAVSNIDILVRIVETKERSISERISETANRQTPVNTRDLHANDWIQRKLEEEFLADGYYYERKKNQYLDKPRDKRLDAELLAQISLAYYLNMPSEARNSKRIVFGEEYSRIFDEENVTASILLSPYILFKPLELRKKSIQSRKRKKEAVPDNEAFISLATFHILYAMRLISEFENIDLLDGKNVEYIREKAIKLVWEVVSETIPKRGELYTHDRFFKERAANKLIYDYIAKTCKAQ